MSELNGEAGNPRTVVEPALRIVGPAIACRYRRRNRPAAISIDFLRAINYKAISNSSRDLVSRFAGDHRGCCLFSGTTGKSGQASQKGDVPKLVHKTPLNRPFGDIVSRIW